MKVKINWADLLLEVARIIIAALAGASGSAML